MKKYQIPIECYTSISVVADSLEEAIRSLDSDSIRNYRETFSEWEVDKEGEVCEINDNGEERIMVCSEMLENDKA